MSSNSENNDQETMSDAASSSTSSLTHAETTSPLENEDMSSESLLPSTSHSSTLSGAAFSSTSSLAHVETTSSLSIRNSENYSSSPLQNQMMSDDSVDVLMSTSSESFSVSDSSTSTSYDNDDNDDETRTDWFDAPIYSQASMSGGDALCQLLRVYVENRLTKKALEDMLTTINLFLPDEHTVPKTKYKLLKLIEMVLPHSQENFSTKHRICSKCYKYLGKWDEMQVGNCLRCNNRDVNSFFLEFDLEAQLRSAFEMRGLSSLIDAFQIKCATRNQQTLYDLTSGSEFIRLKSTVIPGPYDLCLIWYTDGAQVSKSGKSQIWPVYAQIANIEPKFRRSF
ncbi:uncharacterized protein LOC122506605 [Leptopilina heterotoma]|uniref:uncharacterized protein LOC122506605 n=1 Tax=Leptopilina heterotoma TaxID=63436 RepID=UPI001CA9E3BB|nr:uncharacterized protein LOC122506605 [Leptopilina heterotoma]XP_043474830.1 uncharacterized protein LOC122506605 [Leptopilina heterotoma]